MKERIIKTLVVCAFVLSVAYIYNKNKDQETQVSNIVYTKENNYKEIVFQDESQTLIPVNIEVAPGNSREEEITNIIELMKIKPTKFKGLYPVIEEQIEINSVSIKDGLLTLDFNDGLMNLSKSGSLNFLEALTWTLCNYKDIKELHLTCNNNEVTNLPESYISLSQNYNHNLGLNNFESVNAYLHKTSALTVYANKVIDQQLFYVPMTRRINTNELSIQDKVNLLLQQTSISSLLKENELLSSLEALEGTEIIDGKLTVNLNDGALLDEMSLNPQVSDLLMLSLRQIDGVETIEFKVNGEIIGQEEIVSKNVVYNVVALSKTIILG